MSEENEKTIDISALFEDDIDHQLKERGYKKVEDTCDAILNRIEETMAIVKDKKEMSPSDLAELHVKTEVSSLMSRIQLLNFFQFFPPIVSLQRLPDFKRFSAIVVEDDFIFI